MTHPAFRFSVCPFAFGAVVATTQRIIVGYARSLVVVGIALLVTGLFGCASTPRGSYSGGSFVNDDVQYRVEAPGDGWRSIALEDADLAWVSDATHATLLVNSHCQGIDDAPLVALSNHLLFGMTEREEVSSALVEHSGREALERVVTAKLDGVPRTLQTFVLKKDACVYDLVLSAPPASFAEAQAGYRSVRKSFQVLPRKGFAGR